MTNHSFNRLLIGVALCIAFVFSGTITEAEDVLPPNVYGGLFGTYAPKGDCKRMPQISVDKTGLTLDAAGVKEKVTNPDIAYSYGGNYYEGIGVWIFPFSGNERPIIFNFNAGEKKGVLEVHPHDRGWKGGPKLDPKHQALVDASPYAICK